MLNNRLFAAAALSLFQGNEYSAQEAFDKVNAGAAISHAIRGWWSVAYSLRNNALCLFFKNTPVARFNDDGSCTMVSTNRAYCSAAKKQLKEINWR